MGLARTTLQGAGRLVVLVAAFAIGCATGGAGSGDAGGGGRHDGGTRRDAGHRDGGGSPGCTEHGAGSSCQDATDLGAVMAGATVQSMEGLVPQRSAQWLRVSFPPVAAPAPDGGVPSMAGGGSPTIHFVRNDGDAYRFEIRTACAVVASCGGADMATNLTDWSFADDPSTSDEGAGQFSTRDTPWPDTVYVRVFPQSDPGCGSYQIEVTR